MSPPYACSDCIGLGIFFWGGGGEIKSLDPLRAKKTFIRKKLGHTMVSAIKASSVTL